MLKKLSYSDDHHNYYSGHKMSSDFGPQEQCVSIVFQNFTHVYYLYKSEKKSARRPKQFGLVREKSQPIQREFPYIHEIGKNLHEIMTTK